MSGKRHATVFLVKPLEKEDVREAAKLGLGECPMLRSTSGLQHIL